ncbi:MULTISPECIES: hypothetical protein [Cyanophyceae]|uniref:hypothetical protein n=1 Tax=Cyanophyceae TaxID=3028117 RepID=UPI001682FDFA|nr:hypothetical protein [Trichocoleus sp. FACHB-69]MBD1930349.1 hypothetical protein [Trichocoleus sp. FACHB-69]
MTIFVVKNYPIPQHTVVSIDETLAQLQSDVADLFKYQEKLSELKKKQIQENLKIEVAEGIQELASLADSINTLSSQLEAKMLNFKRVAIETNKAYRAIHLDANLKATGIEQPGFQGWKPLSIWQLHHSAVPAVVEGKMGFILTARTVNLSEVNTERDAQRRAEAAEERRKAFEHWLAERRQF